VSTIAPVATESKFGAEPYLTKRVTRVYTAAKRKKEGASAPLFAAST
jgi:hypothetical protein